VVDAIHGGITHRVELLLVLRLLEAVTHDINKLDGVLLKIDFEKAYDKIRWPFL
jgi:hypothetical protein